MKRIIIFDFNRTLYDPESQVLFPGAKETLEALRDKGFDLFMITHQEGARKGLTKDLGIRQYFTQILFTPEKTQEDFQRILKDREVNVKGSFVIGDRAKKEIAIGNTLGFQTIWCRWGKFQDEMPQYPIEYPTHTVKELKEVLDLV